jgi:hypothetical protein
LGVHNQGRGLLYAENISRPQALVQKGVGFFAVCLYALGAGGVFGLFKKFKSLLRQNVMAQKSTQGQIRIYF